MSIPTQLWNTPDPPQEFFVQGTSKAFALLDSLPEQGLAIVGTRNPQPRAAEALRKWVLELEGSRLIILSGLARGIDTIAHWSALAAGLPTIAILGAGLDIPYPKQNQDLRKEILKANGLIVTEFPFGTPALGHHFLKRNRLIAGWSKATWVVQASIPSGALSTARWARELDRTCLAVPCVPGDPDFKGNQVLLDQDHATSFWGIHSLGSIWIELATHSKTRPVSTHRRESIPSEEIVPLLDHVKFLTFQKGGVQVHDLFDWAIQNQWKPEQFFAALKLSVEKKWLSDRQGTLLRY